jgi:hypothetical protein
MSVHVLYGLLLVAGAVPAATVTWLVCLRWMPSRPADLDDAYQQGYDEACDDYLADSPGYLRGYRVTTTSYADPIGAWEDDEPVTGEIRAIQPGPDGKIGTRELRDWREQTAAELSPEHLDAEHERHTTDLPAPAAGNPQGSRGGGLQPIYEDHPLPSVLNLGREYSGDDKTAERVWVRQRMAWDRVEAARRELAVECGIEWVPMDHIALEAAA